MLKEQSKGRMWESRGIIQINLAMGIAVLQDKFRNKDWESFSHLQNEVSIIYYLGLLLDSWIRNSLCKTLITAADICYDHSKC